MVKQCVKQEIKQDNPTWGQVLADATERKAQAQRRVRQLSHAIRQIQARIRRGEIRETAGASE